MESATSAEQYIYHALREGCFNIGNTTQAANWEERVLTSAVFDDYLAWCIKQNVPSIKQVKNTVFGTMLFKHVLSTEKIPPSSKPPETRRPKYYCFPKLDKAREGFQKSFKVGSSIWE